MGQEIADTMEARKDRVLQALHILTGNVPLLTDEKRAILEQYDELCTFGYGRMEVIVVDHHLQGLNPTRHMKRKDLLISPKNT